MMKINGLTTTAFLILALVSLALIQASCTSVPEGDPERGKRWYRLYRCSGCHGEQGENGRAPALIRTNSSFGTFLDKLRSPDSAVMPAYGPDRLSLQDAADIYAWLKSEHR